ncbi:MAG: tetratricopeptide repeat protein, partial [Thermodesulfobacteriota bacterium]
IDPNLGEAHIAIAYALTEHFWDWEAAEAEYKKGLELSPNYATGHQWYAEYLNYMGRYDEAKKEVKIARELDPLSLVILWVESFIYHWSGDVESARRFMDRNIELYPDYSQMYYNKADLLLTEGEYEDAAQLFLKALEVDKVSTEVLDEGEKALKLSGIKGLFNVFLEFHLKQEPINSYRVAQDYYVLGDYESSLDWFERAIEERNFQMIQINQDPLFSDPDFRFNPRFQAILKKMNFPDI